MSEAVYAMHMLIPKRCHCFGTGTVLMDDRGIGNNFGEPCPMCTLGARRSSEVVTGQDLIPPMEAHGKAYLDGQLSDIKRDVTIPNYQWMNRDAVRIKVPNYYHLVDIAVLSWNNGHTVHHRYECATIGCNARGFVTRAGERCDTCAPRAIEPGTELHRVIPSYASIVKTIVAKKRGDARDVYGLAQEIEMRQIQAADRARAAALETERRAA